LIEQYDQIQVYTKKLAIYENYLLLPRQVYEDSQEEEKIPQNNQGNSEGID